jgi:hypothetical protein
MKKTNTLKLLGTGYSPVKRIYFAKENGIYKRRFNLKGQSKSGSACSNTYYYISKEVWEPH